MGKEAAARGWAAVPVLVLCERLTLACCRDRVQRDAGTLA